MLSHQAVVFCGEASLGACLAQVLFSMDAPSSSSGNDQDVEALTLSTTVSQDLTLNSDVLSSMTTAMANHGDVEALTLSTTVSEDLTLNSDVLSSMTTAMANHG
ncbi:uncharacterized protein [Dermacentor andersoni]|uniref:uncharacterized protein isoform X5 n=1 Tax=Dermacentor andersoni TaxID=34620 RepID=UPI003B3ADFFF